MSRGKYRDPIRWIQDSNKIGSSIFGLNTFENSVDNDIIREILASSRENNVGREKMQTFPPALQAQQPFYLLSDDFTPMHDRTGR